MCNSLDGSQRRQRTSTNAISDQGTPRRRRDGAGEKLFQTQAIDEFQSQPGTAEIAAVLHPHAFDIHLYPLRPHVIEETFLPVPARAFGRLLDAQTLRLVELPQIGHHPLPRTALRAVRLHQCPVGVSFAVLFAIHGRMNMPVF